MTGSTSWSLAKSYNQESFGSLSSMLSAGPPFLAKNTRLTHFWQFTFNIILLEDTRPLVKRIVQYTIIEADSQNDSDLDIQ